MRKFLYCVKAKPNLHVPQNGPVAVLGQSQVFGFVHLPPLAHCGLQIAVSYNIILIAANAKWNTVHVKEKKDT